MKLQFFQHPLIAAFSLMQITPFHKNLRQKQGCKTVFHTRCASAANTPAATLLPHPNKRFEKSPSNTVLKVPYFLLLHIPVHEMHTNNRFQPVSCQCVTAPGTASYHFQKKTSHLLHIAPKTAAKESNWIRHSIAKRLTGSTKTRDMKTGLTCFPKWSVDIFHRPSRHYIFPKLL